MPGTTRHVPTESTYVFLLSLDSLLSIDSSNGSIHVVLISRSDHLQGAHVCRSDVSLLHSLVEMGRGLLFRTVWTEDTFRILR